MIGRFSNSGKNHPGGHGDVLNLNVDCVKSTLLYTNKILHNSNIDIINIHADFGLPNVFYKRNAPLFIIDLERSHSDWKLSDPAYFLNDYAFYNRQFIP